MTNENLLPLTIRSRGRLLHYIIIVKNMGGFDDTNC